MRLAYFCKKGGVGKTTVTGEHANCLAAQGHKVVTVSIDDQNSIFEIFGKFDSVFDRENNYLENVILGDCSLDDALYEIRPNLFAIKTLNTDMLSKKLTLERSFEKSFLEMLKKLDRFDYIFFDLPPSSNRTSEILLDLCDAILLIVELNKLGINGFYNTLQYFVDSGLSLDKIKYILPNGFSKHKAVPQLAFNDLVKLIEENLQGVKILPNIPEKAFIQTCQQKGISIFDERTKSLTSYERTQKALIKEQFEHIFSQLELK